MLQNGTVNNTLQGVEQDSDDYDLSTANAYEPSSMGVTFLAEFPPGAQLVVEVTGASYRPCTVRIGNWNRTWWVRQPVRIRKVLTADAMNLSRSGVVSGIQTSETPPTPVDVRIEVFSRPPRRDQQGRLVTVCAVNRSKGGFPTDGNCLFQTRIEARIESGDGRRCILPYPDRPYRGAGRVPDSEEASLALLYRHMQTFAIGHGCAANWDRVVQRWRVEHSHRRMSPAIRSS